MLTATATRPIPMAMAPLTATRVLAMAPVQKATRVMATAILPTATPATAIRGMVMAAATIGQPIAPSTMAVIDQPTVPPSTEAIGSPAALRSTALVGAEPLSGTTYAQSTCNECRRHGTFLESQKVAFQRAPHPELLVEEER